MLSKHILLGMDGYTCISMTQKYRHVVKNTVKEQTKSERERMRGGSREKENKRGE